MINMKNFKPYAIALVLFIVIICASSCASHSPHSYKYPKYM